MSYNRHRGRKDWPESPISESFQAKAVVVYSDHKKYTKEAVLDVWFSTDYNYMVYHLRKDMRFNDDERPDLPFASISYDEYIARQENEPNPFVGSMDKNLISSIIPIEMSNRIVAYRNQPLYIEILAHKVPKRHILMIKSLGISPNFDISEYE
ncbi:hypothetical protein LJC18_04670 [Lachnospiraceae bacterium OttesenSCG-928-E19]|nr:hypothetical protein [Lachnospiraceae bacterium OttesenSCG-928-E19]